MLGYNLNESEAKNMIYNGGLGIYSTLDVSMQNRRIRIRQER